MTLLLAAGRAFVPCQLRSPFFYPHLCLSDFLPGLLKFSASIRNDTATAASVTGEGGSSFLA